MKKALFMLPLLAIALTAGLLWSSHQSFLRAPMDVPGERMRFEVRPGDSVLGVIGRLQEQGVTRDNWHWRLLLWLEPVTIQAGEYWLESGLRPGSLLSKLANGQVIQYRFTIVEGWNWRQLRAALLANERMATEPGRLDDEQVMQAIGSEQTHPEGWFLPETYAFVRGDTAVDILQRAHRDMRLALEQVWDSRMFDVPLNSPYELLVLASIVEKETALQAERPDIAGVFARRLQSGWRLETDPTVIYGLGPDFDGDIRKADLRKDTPYNTYTRHGLPPTPIAMPGLSALQAAARPALGSAMFFVADGSGGHVFSDTLEQHNQAVQQLLQRRKN